MIKYTKVRFNATYYRRNKSHEKEKNDVNEIPAEARILLKLQPKTSVEQSPGFKDLARESESVVNECRLRLKAQLMKVAQMNVHAIQDEITEVFVESLPRIAELLIAFEFEDNEVQDHHRVVADLIGCARDEAISFLNISDEKFAATYCKVNSIDSFPSQSTPKLIQPSTSDTEAESMRGGAADNLPDGGGIGRGRMQTPRTTPPNQSLLTNRPALPTNNDGEDAVATTNAAAVTPWGRGNNTGAARGEYAGTPQQQQQQHYQFTQQVGFDYGQFSDVDATSQNETSLALVNPNAGNNSNNAASEESKDDADMAETEEGDGGGGANNTGGNTENPYARPARANDFNSASSVLIRNRLIQVHYAFLEIIERAFIKPRQIYDKQVAANDRALRMKKVAQRQTLQSKADKVSEAVQAEEIPDPKIIRIMIDDSVQVGIAKALGEKEKERKRSDALKKAASQKAKNGTGAQRKGGASKKLPTNPTNKPNHPQRNGTPGRGNATAGGSRSGRTPNIRRKSKGRGGASKTARSKSRDATSRK